MNYFSGVDHGTSDRGASLLARNHLSSAMDSQSKVKGITCCYCYFFCNFLSVICCSDIQKGSIKVFIVDNELRLMKHPVVPIGHCLFCTCYILVCLFRFRDQRFL